MKRFQLVIPALLALSACSPKTDTRGYTGERDWKNEITTGKTSKDDVLSAFGSPSAQSSFGQESWYYITSKKEAVAFLKPEIVEQKVVRIDFDAQGIVSNVASYSKDDSKDLELVKRITPTEGHSMGFFEQVLGNVGRFNNPAGNTGSVAPGRNPNGGY